MTDGLLCWPNRTLHSNAYNHFLGRASINPASLAGFGGWKYLQVPAAKTSQPRSHQMDSPEKLLFPSTGMAIKERAKKKLSSVQKKKNSSKDPLTLSSGRPNSECQRRGERN